MSKPTKQQHSAKGTRATTSGFSSRHKRRRVVSSCGAVALATFTTFAGLGATATGAGASTPINITWETMWSGPTLTLLNQMIKAFEKTHPGITVTQTAIPGSTGDAKLESQIAAGDPPDVFTEWNPVLGEYAADGLLDPLSSYLTGKYAGFEKWLYPIARDGGVYKGTLYAVPMAMNSFALYYNKPILKAAGIKHPPTTLTQLYNDQAKEWIINNGKLDQIGFYPNGGWLDYAVSFGAENCLNTAGAYDLATCPAAIKEANWYDKYAKYSYADVDALEAAEGYVDGGYDDAFAAGKEGFELSGPWIGAQDIPDADPTMEGNFGVVAFPGPDSPATWGNGNYNIIPKGAADPQAAFEFTTWLAGYGNSFMSTELPKGGWMPTSAQEASQPAFKAWARANPWLDVFIDQMSSEHSVTPTLTTTESEFETAVSNASGYILEKKMTPMKALQYVDSQSNQS